MSNDKIFQLKDDADCLLCEVCGEGPSQVGEAIEVTDKKFDSPLKCEECDIFLENKLTAAGLESLREEISNQQRYDREGRTPYPYSEYLDFYGVDLLRVPAPSMASSPRLGFANWFEFADVESKLTEMGFKREVYEAHGEDVLIFRGDGFELWVSPSPRGWDLEISDNACVKFPTGGADHKLGLSSVDLIAEIQKLLA